MDEYEFQLQIAGPNTSRQFSIPVGTTTIGRLPGNDLQLDEAQVSRQHARIECTGAECQITDLGSSNGTRVDGQALTPSVPMPLTHLAIIKIGSFDLIFKQILAVAKEAPAVPAPSPQLGPAPIQAEPVEVAVPGAVETMMGSPPPTKPPPPLPPAAPEEQSPVPPGLSLHSSRLLGYLPGIYHTDFMARFLGIFESILTPIEWNIDNFDLYLHPGTAPVGFIKWLADWFGITFDRSWTEAQRRTFLAEAHEIYARRGTRRALSRILEIHTGHVPEILDLGKDREPYTFTVRLPMAASGVNKESLERLIDASKPAHTTYRLEFRP